MITETDKAYAAGIVDGEGCLYIDRPGGSYIGCVAVSMTDFSIPEWFRENWGGNLHRRENSKTPHHKPRLAWRIGARLSEKFLRDIYPYLKIKREQCGLLRILRLYKGTPNRPPAPCIMSLRQRIRDRILVLNKRGRPVGAS